MSREEFEALLKRVQQLEQQLAGVDANAVAEMIVSGEAKAPIAAAGSDQENFIENVVSAVQFRQEAVDYPWMDANQWALAKKGMTEDEIRELFGRPTMDDPSLRKRIDRVYTYRARSVATGKLVKRFIRFADGVVVEIEAKDLK